MVHCGRLGSLGSGQTITVNCKEGVQGQYVIFRKWKDDGPLGIIEAAVFGWDIPK